MSLSDTEICITKPAGKEFVLTDENGFFLLMHASGSKYWQYKCRFSEIEKKLAHSIHFDLSQKEGLTHESSRNHCY
jgi:hypothetical protein